MDWRKDTKSGRAIFARREFWEWRRSLIWFWEARLISHWAREWKEIIGKRWRVVLRCAEIFAITARWRREFWPRVDGLRVSFRRSNWSVFKALRGKLG